jgi:hypothetical protein
MGEDNATRYRQPPDAIPQEVLAVGEWSPQELVAHVFGGDPPADVRLEFLGDGYSNRSVVQHALQEKEGRGDLIFQRAHTRLVEIFYDNGRRRPIVS